MYLLPTTHYTVGAQLKFSLSLSTLFFKFQKRANQSITSQIFKNRLLTAALTDRVCSVRCEDNERKKKNMINIRTESSSSDLSNTLRKRNLAV